jgi:hypothetical protein
MCLFVRVRAREQANAHEAWTSGKEKLLATDDYSTANLGGVLALKKRHEAFQSDLMVSTSGLACSRWFSNLFDLFADGLF